MTSHSASQTSVGHVVGERLLGRPAAQRADHLVAGHGPGVAGAELLLHQLPELAVSHARQHRTRAGVGGR